MRFIPTKTHAIVDYVMAIFLGCMPWLFNFAHSGPETWVPVVLAAGIVVYSLLTDYEMGASKVLSMRTHLMLDLAGGLLLAASPWLFGFADYVYKPHLILGILEIGAALMTKTHSPVEKDAHRMASKNTLPTH